MPPSLGSCLPPAYHTSSEPSTPLRHRPAYPVLVLVFAGALALLSMRLPGMQAFLRPAVANRRTIVASFKSHPSRRLSLGTVQAAARLRTSSAPHLGQSPGWAGWLSALPLSALGALGVAAVVVGRRMPTADRVAMLSVAGAAEAPAVAAAAAGRLGGKASIYGETLRTLTERLAAAGHPAYRAGQIMKWVYKKRVTSWDTMSDLPKPLRAWLDDTFILNPAAPLLGKRSNDETQKVLLELQDRSLIETVLIQAPQEEEGEEDPDFRKTVCVSTQVGCAMGCKFCASGLAGWKRNLTTAEIIGQLLAICHREDPHTPRPDPAVVPFDNVVFMGMGEPLANFTAVLRALEIMNAPWGLHFGARRITVSTSGLAPRIRELADAGVAVRLAISLHGATDEVRNQIMPINRSIPLAELIDAAAYFEQKHGRMLTLEFILIEGVNDTVEQAQELVKVARRLHAHVNCIPYNVVDGLDWKRPSIARQTRFVAVLREAGVSCTIRRQKGDDIAAACGQLRLKVEKERELGLAGGR